MLGNRVVEARQKIILGCGVARTGFRPFLQDSRKARPFPVPGVVLSDLFPETCLDQGEVAELAASGKREERVVRPAVIAREELEHAYSLSSSVTGGTTG